MIVSLYDRPIFANGAAIPVDSETDCMVVIHGGTAITGERIAVIAILGRIEAPVAAHRSGTVGVRLVVDQIPVVVEAGEAAGEVLGETR